MPRFDDLRSVMVIGSGPIVIGQGCEFDYSGTQAIRALREEGLRVVLINSNPATIMTDPEMADATYIEPLTFEACRAVLEKERPDVILPTLGGQTALNLAIELSDSGMLEDFGVRLIGVDLDAIRRAEDRSEFKALCEEAGFDTPRSAVVRSMEEALAPRRTRPARDHSSVLYAGRKRQRHGAYPRGVRAYRQVGLAQVARARSVDRGIHRGMEGIRTRNDARSRWQPRGGLLHRESGSHGRTHGGQHHGRAGADASRPRVSGDARRRVQDHGCRRHPGRCERAVRDRAGHRAHDRDRNEPAGIAVVGPGEQGDRLSDRQGRGAARARLHAGRTSQRYRGTIPAAFEPSLDYVVVKIPRWNFEKFRGVVDVLDSQMQSIGEVMALGRTFNEALQKALRSLESDWSGLDTVELPTSDLERLLSFPTRCGSLPSRRPTSRDWTRSESTSSRRIDPWFLENLRMLVEFESELRGHALPPEREVMRDAKRFGFSDRQLATVWGEDGGRGHRGPRGNGHPSGGKDGRHLRRRI